MRIPVSGAQFRRDVKLAQKRGKDMAKLRDIILLLGRGQAATGPVQGSLIERRVEPVPRLSHRA